MARPDEVPQWASGEFFDERIQKDLLRSPVKRIKGKCCILSQKTADGPVLAQRQRAFAAVKDEEPMEMNLDGMGQPDWQSDHPGQLALSLRPTSSFEQSRPMTCPSSTYKTGGHKLNYAGAGCICTTGCT